ncbi:MAG: lytic transglycosylase domain-containing protein [Rhodospirillales bacterium]|nr:lytic transglycosylase domain-containing protein [Rhodospirillales bacterium]
MRDEIYGKFLAALIVLSLLAIFVNTSAYAATRAQIKQLVVEEAINQRVPPALALAVAKVESDFQVKAKSKVGARGVMQIMPKTARTEFGVDANKLWNPRTNIRLGLKFLKQLRRQYGGRWDLALSHYNGGTLKGRGAKAKPHSYTKKYVASVLRWQNRYREQATVWQVASMKDRPYQERRVKVKPYRSKNQNLYTAQVKPKVKWRPRRASYKSYDARLEDRIRRAQRILDDFSEYLDDRS